MQLSWEKHSSYTRNLTRLPLRTIRHVASGCPACSLGHDRLRGRDCSLWVFPLCGVFLFCVSSAYSTYISLSYPLRAPSNIQIVTVTPPLPKWFPPVGPMPGLAVIPVI